MKKDNRCFIYPYYIFPIFKCLIFIFKTLLKLFLLHLLRQSRLLSWLCFFESKSFKASPDCNRGYIMALLTKFISNISISFFSAISIMVNLLLNYLIYLISLLSWLSKSRSILKIFIFNNKRKVIWIKSTLNNSRINLINCAF